MARWMWHHRAHQEWGKSRLYFWRVSFSPTYNRSRVRDGVLEALTRHRVVSYVAYEVLGHFDILLRLWLPTDVQAEELDSSLYEALLASGYHSSDFFEARTVLWHWIWESPADPRHMRELSNNTLLHPPMSDQVLQLLDEFVGHSSSSATFIDEAPGLAPEPLDTELRQAETLNLISNLPHSDGIKFFMIVSQPIGSFGRDDRSRLERRIVEITRAHEYDVRSDERVLREFSVYGGSGFGSFLIVGRIASERFNDVVGNLAEELNSLGLEGFHFRSYTYVGAETGFFLYAERLGLSVSRGPDATVEDLLSMQESQVVELKSSAFVSLRSVIDEGMSTYSVDKDVTASIVKTVCGLLNSTSGGQLLIGAVEVEAFVRAEGRYKDRAAATAAEEKLRTLFPSFQARQPGAPEVVLCGIGPDLDGGDFTNWDVWQRRLQQRLVEHLEPNPLPWLTIRDEHVNGVTIAVISVRPNDSAWSYAKVRDQRNNFERKFYVREGNHTRAFEGVEADDYKRAASIARVAGGLR